ncbi:MAG TPA: hypothetical protein VFY93_10385 [Planctomycetota bacterium]|nr:hypothetical protein [Planctomycetota bacterium]
MKLGDMVRDPISGFEGIAVSETLYLNGCIRIGVQRKPRKGETYKSLEDLKEFFDRDQLAVVKPGAFSLAKKRTGGPMAAPRDEGRPR